MNIRLEEEKDYKKVELLLRESFSDLYGELCDEHYIINLLRNKDCFIKELAFVLEEDNEIVSYLSFSKAKLVNENNEVDILTICPLATKPSSQKKGYGFTLLNYGIEKAKELGHKMVIIYGDPSYYNRFNFVQGNVYNVGSLEEQSIPAFLVLELEEGYANTVEGSFVELHLTDFTKEAFLEYDQNLIKTQ
ncbi:GNAT family N-acetyltransferase [Candidatus Izemoplasma sp. B36]|uniref:GNAT family N-acetyltransferase n=1 Tax=Candidatus Izemoplasma sp. B36 TaxID=3242468 RepID=UPI003555FDE0